MKTRFSIMCLVFFAVVLLNTSCASTSRSPKVAVINVLTDKQLLLMPPFTATLEKIDIYYRGFFAEREIDLWLKTDSGYRACLSFAPANKSAVDFAHTLREGQSYSFPQVLVSYLNGQNKQGQNVIRNDKQ